MLLFRVEAVPTKQPYLSSLFRVLSSFHLSSHSLQGNNDLFIMKRWTVYRWWFVILKKIVWDHDFFRIWLFSQNYKKVRTLKWNIEDGKYTEDEGQIRATEKKRISKDKRFLKNRSTLWYPKNVLLFCIFVWLGVLGGGVDLFVTCLLSNSEKMFRIRKFRTQ